MTINKLSDVLKLHGFYVMPFIGGLHLTDADKNIYDTVYLIDDDFSPDGKIKGSLSNWLGY